MRNANQLLRGTVVALAVGSLPMGAGYSAEIKRVDRPVCELLLQGVIESGDLDRLKASFGNRSEGLCLDSPGGRFSTSLDIAEWIVGKGVTTVLDKDAICFSSCAIIFTAGSRHFESGVIPDRKMHVSATLGFHAPYLVFDTDERFDSVTIGAAYKAGLIAVARMMDLGRGGGALQGLIPNAVILELLKKGPDEAYLVDTTVRAKELGIDLFGVPKAQWNFHSACNACKNRKLDASECGDRDFQYAKTARISADVTQVLFEGYGGEGVGYCAVSLTKAKSGRTSASIIPLVWEDNLPIKSSEIPAPLHDDEALPPTFHLGR